MREWLGLPIAASAEAAPIDQTLVLVHWLMLVLFVGWSTFFVFVLIRFRQRATPSGARGGVGGRWATGLEIAILAAEIALLGFFSIPVWSARVNAIPVATDAVELRVVAEQFTWNVHYPGPDRAFGRTRVDLIGPVNPLGLDQTDPAARDDVATVNELHVPVGRPAIVYLTSKDVVHSFTLPQMRVKQDAIPGSVQPVWFTPTLTGRWEIVCSQLCGLAHYRMRGVYVVESDADFRAWLASGGQ
jgi:cytochrome c oxidase subunit 2